MKKLIYSVMMTGALLASCASNEEPDFIFDSEPVTWSSEIEQMIPATRTVKDAILIANSAKSMLDNNEVSRASNYREIDEGGIQFITDAKSRSGNDTLIYIVNYKDNSGFAVISARTTCDSILAVTESGHYDVNNGTDNPGLAMFMDYAVSYVREAPSVRSIMRKPAYQDIVTTTKTDSVSPRVKVDWGQSGIYGAYCPNEIAGCSNVAMAMTMSALKYPASIQLKHQSSKPTLTLEWDKINNHKFGLTDGDDCEVGVHSTIGLMLRELGYRANSTYYTDLQATGTSLSDVRSTMKGLGFTLSDTETPTSGFVWKWIGNGVIIMGGQNVNNTGGHMWVADGYRYTVKTTKVYVKKGDDGEWVCEETGSTSTTYNHFNWGWDGYCNGYFNDGVYKSTVGDYSKDIIYFVAKR